ncbi:MAG TPA: hypothetical protein VHZ31_08170 [Solirubrobacteraceae bacterium]|nr:hypothetical protein [Solirubrobacteraceae bacterium]
MTIDLATYDGGFVAKNAQASVTQYSPTMLAVNGNLATRLNEMTAIAMKALAEPASVGQVAVTAQAGVHLPV